MFFYSCFISFLVHLICNTIIVRRLLLHFYATPNPKCVTAFHPGQEQQEPIKRKAKLKRSKKDKIAVTLLHVRESVEIAII
jgi:hypothetical protein